MTFKMSSVSNTDKNFKTFCLGCALFVSGGFMYYVYMKYVTPSQKRRDPSCIARQIHEVKHEVTTLKKSLTDAVFDVRKELDGIRGAVSRKNRLLSSESMHTAPNVSDEDDDDDYFLSVENFPTSVNDSQLIGLDNVFIRVDTLNEGSDEDKERALRILQDQECMHPNSCELMWRLARAHVALYELRTDHDVRHVHARSALDYARCGISINNNSVDAHKWCAISLGIVTDFVGTKEKIEAGYELKNHVERAIEIDPNQAVLHYMKGRWSYGVYMLTWIERKLAATLFTTPPCASIEEAMDSFIRAEELEPGFYKANQLYLAKCYYEKKQYEEAKKWAESSALMPVLTRDDKEMHTETENLLKKLL